MSTNNIRHIRKLSYSLSPFFLSPFSLSVRLSFSFSGENKRRHEKINECERGAKGQKSKKTEKRKPHLVVLCVCPFYLPLSLLRHSCEPVMAARGRYGKLRGKGKQKLIDIVYECVCLGLCERQIV